MSEPLARLFARHDRGLVASRFSRFNPRAEGAQTIYEGADLVGGLQLRRARARSQWRDYTGRVRATVEPGSLVVQRFAAASLGDASRVARAIADLRPQLVEAWVESQSDRLVLGQLGASWLGTKVTAFGEMRGLFSLDSRGDVRYGVEGAGLARLALPWDRAAAARELARERPLLADHYSHYNRRHSWSACALRGYSWDPAFIEKPSEMSRAWREEHPDALYWPLRDTPLLRRFPSVEALLGDLRGLGSELHRVRLMALAPGGGELSRHADITDKDAGCADGKLLRLHLPIHTNPGVRFASWQPSGRRLEAHMAEGSAWWLDTRLPHTARNDGPSRRLHLVIDAEGSPGLRALLQIPGGPDRV